MTRRSRSIIIGSIAFILIILALITSAGVFGVSADSIEQDARKSQKINSSWQISKSVNDRLGAIIFYSDTLDDYTYSIYLKRSGLSFGYFFRSGGSNSSIMAGIHEFTYNSNGSALISMNKAKVAKIELDNGVNITKIDVDPTKPFAVVIPANCGSVLLYDVNGNVVPISVVETNG
jgi:hypothetical protein